MLRTGEVLPEVKGNEMSVNPIPQGYHTVTPYLVVSNVSKLIDFLKPAFGAEEMERQFRPDGSIAHAQVRIGDSIVMMGEPMNDGKLMPAMLHLYVLEVDNWYKRAIDAGGLSLREPEDQFYGDRTCGIEDPAGNQWYISTHIEDVSPEEIAIRAITAMAGAQA
jgi:uncharacterized glyoxalase superfamily protein PhnB